MPLTILDIAKLRLGREPHTQADFAEAGFAMLGGCQLCHATIACYNAYPSKSGYWRCEDCIGDSGFESYLEFERFQVLR